ncbi:hypothetical protein ACLOJK_022624, partial [Asimina triloba]
MAVFGSHHYLGFGRIANPLTFLRGEGGREKGGGERRRKTRSKTGKRVVFRFALFSQENVGFLIIRCWQLRLLRFKIHLAVHLSTRPDQFLVSRGVESWRHGPESQEDEVTHDAAATGICN